MKQQKTGRTLKAFGIILPFFIILSVFAASSISTVSKQNIFNGLDSLVSNIRSVEGTIKEEIVYKEELVEGYGTLHNMLHMNIIGDIEFIRDEAGIMQRIEPVTDYNKFIPSMMGLMKKLEESDTPLVFVNLPDRGSLFGASDGFTYSGKTNHDMLNMFSDAGIDIFDVKTLMSEQSHAPKMESFFFRTDIHLPTESEFYLAKELTNYLKTTYQIQFPATDLVYDENQYQWESYSFWGNLGRTAGRGFTGTDSFSTFEPKFKTNLKVENPSKNLIREGDFSVAMTNGYKDAEGNGNLYWVTNYGQYPSPYYWYSNNNYPDGPNLLIIADSLVLRMNTFLSLNAATVTILDPRTFSGTDYVAQCLAANKYDAVLVCGSSSIFYSSSFRSDIEIPEEIRPRQTTGYYGMWLDTVNGTKPAETGKIESVMDDQETVTLVGWATDFTAGRPLSKLYLQIGDRLLQCAYGIERPGLASAYKNENLIKSGFQITFPVSYLKDGITELRFIQVGSDGSYRYEDVIYSIMSDIPEVIQGKQTKGYYGMWLDKVNGSTPAEAGKIEVVLDTQNTVTLVGWATDFTVGKPLSKLYLQVGDRLLRCTYGIERPGLASAYKNENLIKSGFQVTFPVSYLKDGITELRFIQVGSDGSYRYEDVIYSIEG